MSANDGYRDHRYEEDEHAPPQYDCRDTDGLCGLCAYVMSALGAIVREVKAMFSHSADAWHSKPKI